jgi:TonB family protein
MRAIKVICFLVLFASVLFAGTLALAWADSSTGSQSGAAGSNTTPASSGQAATSGAREALPPDLPPILSGASAPSFYTGTIMETHDAHPPDPALLCSTPPKAETRVEMETLDIAQGFDAKSYLEDRVLPVVRANWYRLMSKSPRKNAGNVTVEFEVRKDGTVGETKSDASSDSSLSQIARTVIEKSSPFHALPADFNGQYVRLQGRFSYRPDPTGRNTLATPGSTSQPTSLIRMCNPSTAVNAGSNCLVPPHVIYQTDPEFSPEARQAKYQGTEVLSVVIGADGNVESACMLTSLGYGLDAKGIDSVLKWKFQPATLNGKPQASEVAIEIDFHLYPDKPVTAADKP